MNRPGSPLSLGDAAATCSLSGAAAGCRVRILRMEGSAPLKTRLAALGLRTGATVTIMKAGRRNPTVLAVKGARIVIGRDLADHILVQPDTPHPTRPPA